MDKLLAVFKSEANDVKEGLDGLKGKLDDELTKREQEMAATPAERMDLIQSDIDANKSRLDEIQDGIAGDQANANANAELRGDKPEAGKSAAAEAAARASTPGEAISDAMSDAHAAPVEPTGGAKTVQEAAEDTLDELRAELGLASDGADSSDAGDA